MKMKKIIRLLSLIVMIPAVLVACKENEPTESEKVLVGWVYANDPVSLAELSIYNTKGEQILKDESIVADDQGAIILTGNELPSDFRIVAKKGEQYGEAFDAVLRTDVRDFNADSDKIYINFATTVVGAYMDKNPQLTLEEAILSVKTFLELPQWFDLASGTQLSGEYFSNTQFMSEANQNGGVNSFIDMLLIEMENGTTHPFKEELLLSVGSTIAKELAKGAVSYVGGELMGWGLSKAGVDFGTDHTAEDLAEIKEGMKEMKTKLNEMSIQLNAISIQLKNIQNELKDMLKKITHQQALTEYATRVAQMNTLISSVDTIQRDLNYFVTNPPANPEKMRESLINRIENSIVDNADTIHNHLVGLAGEKSLITLWREIVYEDRFLDNYDYTRVKAQFDFYKKYQEIILLLRVEYYHALEESSEDDSGGIGKIGEVVMECIEHFDSQIAEQEELLCAPIEKHVVVDTKWDVMFYSENIEFGKAESSFSPEGKTSKQVFDYMEELANSNYAGYSDWKALNDDYFGALYADYKPEQSKGNWSQYLISNGWPGETVSDIIVPFRDYHSGKRYPQACFMNNQSHPKNFFEYNPQYAKNSTTFCILMAARWIETEPISAAKLYGYEHLKS